MLAQLPTLGKDEYREGLMWDPECLENAAMVSHTTGTTGRVTWRHRTRAEAAVIAKLFGSRPDLREDPRFGISIRYNRHGMEMPVPGVGTMVPVSLSEDVDVRQVLELLQVGCVLHGVRRHPSVLAGGGMDVAIIARAIVEAGFADAAARIDRVLVGGHLPKAIRATVERALPQATISGHYSLAEVFGGASSLPDGSGYLTEAHVIAEVLDDDDAPVACELSLAGGDDCDEGFRCVDGFCEKKSDNNNDDNDESGRDSNSSGCTSTGAPGSIAGLAALLALARRRRSIRCR